MKNNLFEKAVAVAMVVASQILSRPYTKATIGNMLPATFFSNDRQHY
jgi:hypothetical protein